MSDLIMLEGVNALFKASLSLLLHHSKRILEIDNFEDVVDYLKTKLVDMTVQEQCEVVHNVSHNFLAPVISSLMFTVSLLTSPVLKVFKQIANSIGK